MPDRTPRPGRPRTRQPAGPAAVIGEAIRSRRVTTGLSQTELCRHVEGLTPPMLGRIERGEVVPALDVAGRLAKVFGCTVDDLI